MTAMIPAPKSRRRRGFNLIEIAIVLSIIGIVIGGIYVAASGVTARSKLEATQRQLQQIVHNVRAAYSTRARFTIGNGPPAYTQAKTMHLMPPDIVDTGTEFRNPYDGVVYLRANPASDQSFVVTFMDVPADACTSLLTNTFGTAEAVRQLGLQDAGTGTGHTNPIISDGISIIEATANCDQDLNTVELIFSLRGNT